MSQLIIELQKKEHELALQLSSVQSTIKIMGGICKYPIIKGAETFFINESPVHSTLNNYNSVDPNIPSEWNENLTWADKTLYVLSCIREGFVDDIVNKFVELSPKSEKETVKKNITFNASNLYTGKRIGAKKYGLKNKYSIYK